MGRADFGILFGNRGATDGAINSWHRRLAFLCRPLEYPCGAVPNVRRASHTARATSVTCDGEILLGWGVLRPASALCRVANR